MVLQKRLDYGFNGYCVPSIPRATRSARRCSFRKKIQDNQQCAFDLLASVAGKLLLDGECFPSTGKRATGKKQGASNEKTANKEQKDEGNSQKIEFCDQRCCETSFLGSEIGLLAHNKNNSSKGFICSQIASVITSDCSGRVGCAEKFVVGKSKSEIGSSVRKEEVGLYGYLNLEGELNKHANVETLNTGKALVSGKTDLCCAEDPVASNGKSPALVSSDSSAKMPPCRSPISSGSFHVCQEDVKLGSRDDDENSSGCTQPRTMPKTFRQPSRIAARRIRKLLASKYWKLHPTLRNENLSNIDVELKPVYRNRKACYKSQRSQRIYPFKKRKLYDCSSALNSDGGTSGEDIFSLPKKGVHGSSSGSHPVMLEATGIESSVGGQHTSCHSRDSHVKLRIKSFRVPELFFDISETATIGSLKRTVMEAVTAILGSGFRVGIFLRGKKVRDDNKTLLQTGISHNNKLDALGFALEPIPLQASTSLGPEGFPSLMPSAAPQLLTRCPPIASEVHQGASDPTPDPPVANFGNFVESDHDSAPSPTDMSIDKSAADSQALVAIHVAGAEALSVVPMHQKSKQSEIAQRRIRRPFSVSEVEALVHAVEILGTGRWRDVKLRAFDNAKHRTYVDLKDKWKTLVHTARISPQQRRGEPVPQDLLDRVLTAHSYWSEQQTKQQPKQQQQPKTCLFL